MTKRHVEIHGPTDLYLLKLQSINPLLIRSLAQPTQPTRPLKENHTRRLTEIYALKA